MKMRKTWWAGMALCLISVGLIALHWMPSALFCNALGTTFLLWKSETIKSKNWKILALVVSWGSFGIAMISGASLIWMMADTAAYMLAVVFGRDDDGPSPFRKLFKSEVKPVPVANR
jgi:hypothetical protein